MFPARPKLPRLGLAMRYLLPSAKPAKQLRGSNSKMAAGSLGQERAARCVRAAPSTRRSLRKHASPALRRREQLVLRASRTREVLKGVKVQHGNRGRFGSGSAFLVRVKAGKRLEGCLPRGAPGAASHGVIQPREGSG